MINFFLLFGITVLIAVYSGITFFTNLKNINNQKSSKDKAPNNKIFGKVFVVFLIIAIIEVIVYSI
ncbi:Mid2-like cell wall stress sensor domain protein [Staphylococcus arlettae]|uniref:Mid2-like cell wall stress sensor domain protein n=1 Tax=Staphylococcus arlettae TaxID=29378 RepID=UPI0034649E1A